MTFVSVVSSFHLLLLFCIHVYVHEVPLVDSVVVYCVRMCTCISSAHANIMLAHLEFESRPMLNFPGAAINVFTPYIYM